MAFIGLGAALLADRHVLRCATVIASGVAVIGTGVALLADRHVLGCATVIASGVAVTGSGVACPADRHALIMAMVIASGVAITGFGVAEIGPSTIVSGVRRLVDSVTKAPQTRGNQKSSQNLIFSGVRSTQGVAIPRDLLGVTEWQEGQ